MVKYVFAWFPMVFIAIVNGVLREKGYAPHMSELHAHQLSTLTSVMLFGVYIFGVNRLMRFTSARQAILVGITWVFMTIVFEFVFGHYVMGMEWSRLLHDYNLSSGRIWSLLLLWVLFAPYIFYRLKI